MRTSLRVLVVPFLAVSVAACSGSSSSPSAAASAASLPAPASSVASTAPSTAPSVSMAPSAAASAAPSAAAATTGPTAAPTSIDPCQLVTQDEASKLAGTALPAGKDSTTDNRRMCSYGVTGIVFTVTVIQAPNQAAVDQGKAEFLAGLQKEAGTALKVTTVSGIGDAAAVGTVSESTGGMTLNGAAIYVLKGLTFFAITDIGIGKPVASTAALEAQATTSVGRIP